MKVEKNMKNIVKISVLHLSVLTLAACGQATASVNQVPASSQATSSGVSISSDEAKALVLKAAQIAETDVSNLTLEYDTDNGRAVYDVEFTHQGMEYSYTLDAHTGDVLTKEQDPVND